MKKSRIIIATILTVFVAVALILNIKTSPKPSPVIQETQQEETKEKFPQAIISPVTISDFSNTLFIGDSRTQGFSMFGGITEATYYADQGLSVSGVLNKPIIEKDSDKITIIEALKESTFDNIVIMLGINELGWNEPALFKQYYNQMLDEINITSPDSKIYLQLIMPVNTNLMEEPQEYVNNQRITEFNNIIKEICAERSLEYFDTFSMMCDADGNLITSASVDGIHLHPAFCKRWANFLKGETIYEIFE